MQVGIFWCQLTSTSEGVQIVPVFDCDIKTFSIIAEGPLAFSMRAEGTAEKQRYFILLWEKKILIF